MKRAVFFDLDDTLLWDNRSVTEALEVVCRFVSNTNTHIHPHTVEHEALLQTVLLEAPQLYATLPTYSFTQMIGTGAFEAMWADYQEGMGFDELRKLAPVYRVDVWYRSLRKHGVEDRELAEQLAQKFIHERKRRSYVYEDTYPTLDRLKQQGYRLLLLTNGSPDLQRIKLQNEPKLAPYFEHIVVSGNIGKGKPDTSMYQHALSLLNLSTNDVIMVGDRLTTDILGANRAGIASVWLNREHKTRDESIVPTYEIGELSELFPLLK